ncbi:chorismate mutase [Listeria ilorinensis]|uniref:chorismate mutase n=1 Tax=Listeria ilorinensis TaxID=2867439 RepID=UPI001EF4AD73|nr:chorismate mutase [Listeria ilorinensis]
MRAIRGATTIEENKAGQIYQATSELFAKIVSQNDLTPEDFVSVIITVTEDISAAFPARAVRETPGFERVPVMGMQEIPVPGAPEKCIRMMCHVNIEKSLEEVEHIYLREAVQLRPDLVKKEELS